MIENRWQVGIAFYAGGFVPSSSLPATNTCTHTLTNRPACQNALSPTRSAKRSSSSASTCRSFGPLPSSPGGSTKQPHSQSRAHSFTFARTLSLILIATCLSQCRRTYGGGAQERMETLRKSNWRGTCYVMPCKCASARVLIEATVCALIYVMHSQGGVAYSQPRHNPFAVVA